jgi:uncharacterized protein YdeI (YjbR/CyaY-like superfamily)
LHVIPASLFARFVRNGPRKSNAMVARSAPCAYFRHLTNKRRIMANSRFSEGKGPSQRQLRVGEMIRRKMSQMLLRGETHDAALNAM